LPSAHALHVLPPQSTSLSLPLWMTSLQAGAWHTAAVQTPLVQSLAVRQALPFAQGEHTPPPQSISVSEALSVASTHSPKQTPPLHWLLAQSAFS
jgi:hypothetical protein